MSVASDSLLRIGVYCKSLADDRSKEMEITGREIKSLATVVQQHRSVASLQITRSNGSKVSNHLQHRRQREASCHIPTADTEFFFSTSE
jgi:hypothetical protein